MKHNLNYYLIFVFSLILINCKENEFEKDKEIITNKYFPVENLDQLNLKNVGDLWKNDTFININDYVTASFDLDSNHIKSVLYHSKKNIMLGVSIFSSQESAIAAMKYRISEVSAIIIPKDSCPSDYYGKFWGCNSTINVKDKCWFGQYMNFQRYIFINKWNTIVEIENLDDNFSDSMQVKIENAIIEVVERVDSLSNNLN